MAILVRRVLAYVAACAVAAGAGRATADDIILAEGPERAATIVLPPEPTALEGRAADVLRRGVRTLSRADPEVITGGPPGAGSMVITRGGTADGFRVSTVGGHVELSGNPLAAAYALLDHLGWNQVSLYQLQGWGLSIRRPAGGVVKVADGLRLSSDAGVPVRAFLLTRPGLLLDEFLDWMVGHGMNRVIIRETPAKAERDRLMKATASRGLIVEYHAFRLRTSDDVKSLLADHPEIDVVDCRIGRLKSVPMYLDHLRRLAAALPPGKQVAGAVFASWDVPADAKPLPKNVFLWIGVEPGRAQAAKDWLGVAASPAQAGLSGAWMGSDQTLFAASAVDLGPMLADLDYLLKKKVGGIAGECGPGRWFWDVYSDAANMFARAATSGVTDPGVLRRRFCEVSYGSTADVALEFFAAMDRIRTRAGSDGWTVSAVASDDEAYDVWKKAVRTADLGRSRSPRDTGQRKRWVWRLQGLRYFDACVEAARRLRDARAITKTGEREQALREALTRLLSYNQTKLGQTSSGEVYGLAEAGRPVGLEGDVAIVGQLRGAFLETAGAGTTETPARGAKAVAATGAMDETPVPSVTDGDIRTAAVLPADPLARVVIDLGEVRTVKRVRFLNGPANMVTAFRIQVGKADGALSTVAQGRVKTGALFDWQSVTFAPQQARYVVLRADGFASLSPGGGAGLAEIEVE